MSTRSGGLLELVARGKKDVFFNSNPTISFFHSVYVRSAPFTKEIHILKPRNTPEWGKWVDFDFEHRGDIVKHVYLRLELPSWLPPSLHEINQTGLITYDISGTTFGYCNNIGFQAIECIQFFQDQIIVHEAYGEHLDWSLRQMYSHTETALIAHQIGSRDESPIAIGRSVNTRCLRIPIPILGWQTLNDPGLPMIALKGERFRIRIHLRELEEIIVASDGQLNPHPWGKQLRIQKTKQGSIDTSYSALPVTCMKTIGMGLETTQMYISADSQMFLKAQTLRIPFQSTQFQQYTLEDNILTAASMNPSAQYKFPLPIDFSGSINRMLIGFRSEASTDAGQRTYLNVPIQTMRMNIANIDRIKQWSIPIFREVGGYWKHPRLGLDLLNPAMPQEVYSITFGGFEKERPMGTINFSRAISPTLFLTLSALEYDTRNISRKTHALLYAESWNIYVIANSKGSIMFDD